MTDSTKLSYNEATNSLSYNSQSITDHSWAVFKIQKASNFNIPKEALNSKAPWAVLAMNVFYVPTLPDITTAARPLKKIRLHLFSSSQKSPYSRMNCGSLRTTGRSH